MLRNQAKYCLILTVWCILILGELQAGGNNETGGGRSHALGNASVSLVDVWSTTNNPGALGALNHYAIGIAYESRYFLPEAAFSAFTFAGPLGGGSIGIIGHTYGYAAYRDNRIGLSYGRQLSDYLSLGVQINYSEVRISNGYGRSTNVVGEVGLLVKPTDKWRVGVHLYNPTRARLAAHEDERIPTMLSIGCNYRFSDKVKALFEVEKSLNLPINFQSGIEYCPVENLFLRTGYSTLNGSYAIGLGYRWKGIVLDISNQWDQTIGFGATASLSYRFGERKKSNQ